MYPQTMSPDMMTTMYPQTMVPDMSTMYPQTMSPDMMTTMYPQTMAPDMSTMGPQTMSPSMMTTMGPQMPSNVPTQIRYKIHRWDAVLSPNGLNKQPMIYIYPDINFINLIKMHDEILSVQINNTNTLYDGQVLYGTVSRSSFIPNFYSKTQLYVVILDCEWYGYPNPSELGLATFGSPV
jgi:hypothetical protein